MQAGEIEGGFAQGLAGHRAGIDATAAGVLRAFDDGDALAEVRGLGAGLFASGTAADYQQIKVVVGRHRILRTGKLPLWIGLSRFVENITVRQMGKLKILRGLCRIECRNDPASGWR